MTPELRRINDTKKVGAWRAKNRAAGLCPCGGSRLDGRKLCAKCANRSHAQLQARSKSGLCGQGCGSPARPGKTRCEACAKRQAASSVARFKRNADAGLCTKCGKRPPAEDRTCCQACLNIQKSRSRKWMYGLTDEQYRQKFDDQNGQCNICKRADVPLVVDHDHDTGEVRDLLCKLCNAMIGMAREDIATLDLAKNYLTRWKKGPLNAVA